MEYGYKFRIYPTKEQEDLIQRTFGCCRFVYNHLLAERILVYKTTGKTLSKYEQMRELPIMKKEFEWLKEVDSTALQSAVGHLDAAYQNFFRRVNRIIWHYGHGLHNKNRFSGRYEVILWYTKSDKYTFNLDAVRVPSKYPGKRSYHGPNKGKLSGNPKGKNPEDVWDVPNVKGNHVEKTNHPCQFPVGLIERLVLALTNENDLVFDPFSGVASSGVAALLHKRHFWGCEIMEDYIKQGKERLEQTVAGSIRYRPYDKPIYDAKTSALSKIPDEWKDVR